MVCSEDATDLQYTLCRRQTTRGSWQTTCVRDERGDPTQHIDGAVRTQIIYVIDVSGGAWRPATASVSAQLTRFSLPGDKIPRKGGPGISQSDLLIVNKVSHIAHIITKIR